jgi:hypothetical protein
MQGRPTPWVSSRIAAEALSEVSLEDLRLQMPALRPVGCWSTECARLSPRMQHVGWCPE